MPLKQFTFDEAEDRLESIIATIKRHLEEARHYDEQSLYTLRLYSIYDARDCVRELEDTILGLVYGRG